MKILFTLIVASISFASIHAQNIDKIFGKTWISYSVKVDKSPEMILDEEETATIIYRNNNTYTGVSPDMYVENGTWQYLAKEKLIILNTPLDGTQSFKIISLTDSTLVVESNEEGSKMIMTFKVKT